MLGRTLRLVPAGRRSWRSIHATAVNRIHEFDEKGGFKELHPEPVPRHNLKGGLIELKNHMGMLFKEIKDWYEQDIELKIPVPFLPDEVWKFNGDPETLDKWTVTCDSDFGIGYSKAKLSYSPSGSAVFEGTLDTRLPKDGQQTRSGFCNLALRPMTKAFFRKKILDWSMYNCLILRIRGDGRCYIVNVPSKGYYDIQWNDIFHYPMYTRGGPYWQIVKIPFSKFVFASKGYIADRQLGFKSNRVTGFGITISDKHKGNFRLEIDSISLMYDPYETEETAYESYKQN